MSYKSVPQECPTRVSQKSVPQECPLRVSYKSVSQECPIRVSYRSVVWTYVVFRTCLHSGSWVPSCLIALFVHCHEIWTSTRNRSDLLCLSLSTTKAQGFPCASTQNQRINKSAPAPAQQILRPGAIEMHCEDLEVNECIANSGKFAGHADQHLRSDTRPELLP